MNEHPTSENAPLEAWLTTATRKLSEESVAQVREEIEQHFESAFNEAVSAGLSPSEARLLALASLGNPKAVNRSYRKVLLTAREARMLSKAKRLYPFQKAMMLLACGFSTFTLLAYDHKGDVLEIAWLAATTIVGGGYLLMPARTRITGRIHRYAWWAIMAFIPFVLVELPVITSALGYGFFAAYVIVPNEWACMRLRQKLPVEDWPPGLFM